MIESTIESLIRSLATDPLNRDLRLIYADALDDSGREALALRQRNIAVMLDSRTGTSVAPVPATQLMAARFDSKSRAVLLFPVKDYPEPPDRDWDHGSRTAYDWCDVYGNSVAGMGTHGCTCKFSVLQVQHVISGGNDRGLRIFGLPDTLMELVEPGLDLRPPLLTWAEKVVLAATRGLKSQFRWQYARRTGITAEEYQSARSALADKKMLTKAYALTNAGRNAIGFTQLDSLRRPTETVQ